MFRNQRIQEKRFCIFVLLMLICILGIGLPKQYAVRFLPDEFGYWSYAAKVLGYDWSHLVSLEGYYSFGYSLILLPIMFFFRDAVMAYRIAIIVNAILLVVCGAGLYYIGLFLMEDEQGNIDDPKKTELIFCTALSLFYPSYLFYMQVTMTEITLMTSFIMVCVMFISYIKKQKIRSLVGLVGFALWMYSIHMRSIGVLIALIIALGIFALKDPKKRKLFFVLVAVFALGLLLLTILKNFSKEVLWSSASEKMLRSNDYYGRWKTIVKIVTESEHRKAFCIGAIGKLLYLIGSTGGLFLWGIYYFVKKIWEEWKLSDKKTVIRVFLLLSALAAFGITAIAMRGGRIDLYFYGRYTEYILAPIILAGFWGLRELKKPWRKVAVIEGITIAVTVAFYYFIMGLETSEIASIHIPGITAYTGSLGPKDWRFYVYMGMGFCMNILVVSFVTLWKHEQRESLGGKRALCVLVLAGEMYLSVFAMQEKSYWGQTLVYEELELADYLEERQSQGSRIIYLNQGGGPWIDTIQFLKRDMKIQIYYPNQIDNLQASDVVLTLSNDKTPKKVKELYGNAKYVGAFYVYDIEEGIE